MQHDQSRAKALENHQQDPLTGIMIVIEVSL